MSYTNIPNELWEFMIDQKSFSRQTRIFAMIVRFTVCYHREFHELSLSFIAERLNVRRDHVSEEIKKMIDSNIIRFRQVGNKRLLAIGFNVPDLGNVSVPKNGGKGVPKNGDQEINNIQNNNLKNNDQTSFDRFWIAYPRKVSKPNAVKAFHKAIQKTDLDTLIDGLEQYKKHLLKNNTEERFIKHPASWLNAEGWNDYTSGPQPKVESNILRIVKNQSEEDERDREFIRELYRSREAKETRNCVRADRKSV